jgi:hypothetical protein
MLMEKEGADTYPQQQVVMSQHTMPHLSQLLAHLS